jgi:hypothetical protein
MDRPQQPELYRSGNTALEPDSIESEVRARRTPRSGGETGKVPDDNRPGHHPHHEQDQPDHDAVARRLGVVACRPTKQQLYAEARRQRISGRSKMTKAELERALEQNSG